MDTTCPKCDLEFEITELWEPSKCPNCNNAFIFDEICAEDYSDCWIIILWESNNYEY